VGLLFDALTELEHLSLQLQEKKITLPETHHLVSVKYHVLQSMANNPGENYSEVLNVKGLD
jgi:two-component sensor histidine kinase